MSKIFTYGEPLSTFKEKAIFYSLLFLLGLLGVLFYLLHPFLFSPEKKLELAKKDALEAFHNINTITKDSPNLKYSTDYSFVDISPIGDDCYSIISVSKFGDTGFSIMDTCIEGEIQ